VQEPSATAPVRSVEPLGSALRGWLVRVLSLTEDLTPWSVAEAQRELTRLVGSDHRYAFAPTGLPALLGEVADYYAAAAEVAAPIDELPPPSEKKVGPVLVRQPERDNEQERVRPPANVPPIQPPVPKPPVAKQEEPHPLTSEAPPHALDAPEPVQQVQQPAVEQVQQPAVEQIQHPAVEQVQHPAVEQVQHPAVEQVQHPAVEQVQHPAVEQVQHPAVEQVQQPVVEPVQHPAVEQVQLQAAEQLPEAAADLAQQPPAASVQQAGTDLVHQPTAELAQRPLLDLPPDASEDTSIVGPGPELTDAAVSVPPPVIVEAGGFAEPLTMTDAVDEQPPTTVEAGDLLLAASPLAFFAMEPEAAQQPEPQSALHTAAPTAVSTARRPSASPPTSTATLTGARSHGADTEVGPLAESINVNRHGSAFDRGDGAWREARYPAASSTRRPLFGVHATDDEDDVTAAPPRLLRRTLIGIAAAALVILTVGGYASLRPSSGTKTADRHASAPASTAAKSSSPSVAPVVAAPRADSRRVPPPSQPTAAPPPAAATAPAAAPQTGTVEVVSPVQLSVSEDGRALGASGEPIRLPAGRHTLEIGREDLGYRTVEAVDVKPGRPSRIQPALPSGAANLNATPWAEVWVDGKKVGETPLGHVPLTIGPHEVQFRHPELGTQTRTLVVTTGAPALLSVDMKK